MRRSRPTSCLQPAIARRAFFALGAGISSALVLGSNAAAFSGQRRALPQGLARALHAYNRATIHKDISALAALVTDDYVLVNSDASVQDKSSYLADFAMPDFSLEPFEIVEPLYRLAGDTALTGGVFHLNWSQHGLRKSRTLRFAHLWTKDKEAWRIWYSQLTRVPDPP